MIFARLTPIEEQSRFSANRAMQLCGTFKRTSLGMASTSRFIEEASTADLISLSIISLSSEQEGKEKRAKKPLFAYVLTLDDGNENRWNAAFGTALRKALAWIKQDVSASVLITQSGIAKFFSNGLDMQWFMAEKDTPAGRAATADFMRSFADVLDLGIPTICAVAGHAFGAGMMLALAHDYRIQLAKEGLMCAPGISLGVRVPPPEVELIAHAVPRGALTETVLGAKRWTGKEAYARGIVHAVADTREELDAAALRLAATHAKLGVNRALYHDYKKQLNGHLVAGIGEYCDRNARL